MRFGIRLGFDELSTMIRRGMQAEKFGFDSIWISDHFISTSSPYCICPETWTVITAIGLRTKHAILASSVTDPLRRHPAALAQLISTLDNLLNGRIALGIGAGEAMNLLPFGIDFTYPLSKLRESIEYMKRLWVSSPEKPAVYSGNFFQLKDAYLTIRPIQKPHPPIYIGALSPKTRELVGEMANGLYPFLVSPKTFKRGLLDVARGAKRVGRKIEEIDSVARGITAVSDNREEARKIVEKVAKRAAVLDQEFTKQFDPSISIEKDVDVRSATITRNFLSKIEKEIEKIPDSVVDAVCFYGSSDDCIEKIEQFIEAGARHFVITNVDPKWDRTMKAYSSKILPYLREEHS